MEQLKGKKILVTGGAGFIGFHLCKKLSDFTPNLTIYDNLSSGKLENVKDFPKANFIKGDMIFHLAAQVVVPYSMENPVEDFETNARGTLNVLEKARKDDARLVFASSAAVYGNPTKLPTSEDYGFNPFSCYGLSKVVGEEYCNMYVTQYGLDITILRLANVYGPRCHGVISDFLDKISKNPAKLEIIGTGLQSRDFVHVSDAVDALMLSAVRENALGQTFNIGLGKTTKIIDLAKMILEILNLSDKTVITTTNVSWKGDIDAIWFDICKAQKELKWYPRVSLEDSLREMIRERKMMDEHTR
jgi:UDP-glucose 4-epimerase